MADLPTNGAAPVDNQPPPLSFDDDDIFAIPPAEEPRGPHTGRNHPQTSRDAAERAKPQLPSIRRRVMDYALSCGPPGFIDDELVEAVGEDGQQGNRSVIPRRIELVEANWLMDSGRTRTNARGNRCVVWVHRDFASQPPPVCEPAAKAKATVKPAAEVAAAFAVIDKWAQAMKSEGRLVNELFAAIATVKVR